MSDNGHATIRAQQHDWQREALQLRRAFETQETMLEAQRREIARLRRELRRAYVQRVALVIGLSVALAVLLRR